MRNGGKTCVHVFFPKYAIFIVGAILFSIPCYTYYFFVNMHPCNIQCNYFFWKWRNMTMFESPNWTCWPFKGRVYMEWKPLNWKWRSLFGESFPVTSGFIRFSKRRVVVNRIKQNRKKFWNSKFRNSKFLRRFSSSPENRAEMDYFWTWTRPWTACN